MSSVTENLLIIMLIISSCFERVHRLSKRVVDYYADNQRHTDKWFQSHRRTLSEINKDQKNNWLDSSNITTVTPSSRYHRMPRTDALPNVVAFMWPKIRLQYDSTNFRFLKLLMAFNQGWASDNICGQILIWPDQIR